MNRLSIKFKAIFLTLLFLLNTAIGFACTIGVNMGFNKSHHNNHSGVNKSIAHSHLPGIKKHSHEHDHAKTHELHHIEKHNKDKNDNCCKDEVAKFISIDKQTIKSSIVKIPLLLPGIIVTVYQPLYVFVNCVHTPKNSYFVTCHHPPIPDIRVAVQSFQI
jgi:hypothetical protein